MGFVQTGEDGFFPLSLSQQNIWDVERTCPDTSINNISTTLHIWGRVDFSLLQHSVELVVASDGSLRTRLTLRDGQPWQYHAPFQPDPVPVYDFSQTAQSEIEAWQDAVTRQVFPLLDAPLYRFFLLRTGENSGALLIKTHHIISDGWSQALLCNRIGQAYLDLLSGQEPVLQPSPSYALHVQEETDYLASSACQRDEAYWTQALREAGEPSLLKSVRGAAVSPVGRRRSFALPEDLNNAIYSFCMNKRVAPFSVFCMALAIYFKRIGGADRSTIGVPIFNRMNFTAKQTSGMFVSTLPFSTELSDDWSFHQFNEHLAMQWFELLRHQRYPFSRIQALAQAEHGDQRLFHIAFSYQNSQLLESRSASVRFSGRWHYSGYQLEQLCIHLSNVEDDRRYSVDYDYQAQLFSGAEIDSLHACLVNILRAALTEPDRPISQLPLLSPGERERVLYSFNRSARPIFEASLYGRFTRFVREHPGRAALIHGGKRTTYAALEELSARVHAALEPVCTAPDTVVAVLLPRRETLFAAMLGILRAGGAFLLLPPGLPVNRVRDILTQSGAAALLTDETCGGYELDGLLPILRTDALPAPTQLPPVKSAPKALAYVVYTSGSTGTPKGVEIERRSLLNLTCAMEPVYAKGAVLSLCSIGFDAFLLESAAALLNGRTVVLPEDADLESPLRLANLITGYGVGFLSTTPSRLAAFLKQPEFQTALGRLETILCGGEAFPGDLLQRLSLLTRARIFNQYGPSEATVGVSLKLLNDTDAITAGPPMANCKLYVLDRWLSPLPVGVYGDVYIGGLCVGRGYRGAPELTASAFLDSPFELGDRLYRTGDIGCWTAEGELLLAGRSDKQVKLRGLRVEPQEVATCLARHPQVREATACVKEWDGQKVLVAYYTSAQPVQEQELLTFAASWLPHYMIPAAIVRLDALPLTANGKVAEDQLPVPALTGEPDAQAETPAQQTLLAIFRRVLGKPSLGVEDDYFLHGGNSLNAMETLSEIAEHTGISLRIADLYACRTVRRLAVRIEEQACADSDGSAHLLPAPPQDRWPLTPIQQSIYFQSFLDPTHRSYHMAGAFRLSAAPDIPRLEQAFRALIAEEPLLRTVFVQEEDGLFARVLPQAEFTLSAAAGQTLDEAAAPLLEPFDLGSAPLLRAALWEETPDHWTLLLATHHIISDGLTTPILMARLDTLYQGAPITDRPLSFLDYAWQLTHTPRDPGLLDYWKQRLSPLPEPLELPTDRPRPRSADFLGRTLNVSLPAKLSAQCDARCDALGVSPYMFFLGVFGLLLSRLSGARDLTVGAAAAGRLLPETRELCGPFISSLPLRLTPDPDLTLRAWLESVRAEVSGMLDHQQTGLTELSAALDLPAALSQSPLYQVMFTQRPLDTGSFTLGGASMEYQPIATGTSKMDLNLELAREGDHYQIVAEYAVSLFEETTIAFWLRCFQALAGRMAAAREDTPLSALDALTPVDRMELLDLPQNTVVPFVNLPIPRLFERQVELDPDAPAVTFHGRTISRADLDRRANQLANLLSEAGVTPGCQVGIAMSRSDDLVAAVLAIWKTGCAYVPLLAHYPAQRLTYMAETARISHILCDAAARAKLPDGLPCTLVDTAGHASDIFQAVPLRETDLAEVLFTSGSTGRPKGVMLGWRSVANMVAGFSDLLRQVDGPILCTTNVVFDMFNGEVTIPLSMGKPIVMADEEEMMLPWKLAELIRRDGVRITQSTPSRVQMWLTNETFREAAAGLGMMIYGGEVLTEALLRSAQSAAPHAIMTNMYGPTEGTVYNTTTPADYRGPITIGRPMKNNRLYVLDDQLRQVLPTAAGDLYLAGECLSLGYISRPDLTEAAFLPDPFFPGQLMYRTGDVARLRLDGAYDFLGRRDAQVKLNGQRVELDEINGALVSSRCALQAATVPVRRADGSMELFTYYIPDEPLAPADIRARLGKILPAYMIPSHLETLERMPSTPTGKIDLRTLREWAAQGGLPQGERKDGPSLPSTGAATESPSASPVSHPETVSGAPFALSQTEPVLPERETAPPSPASISPESSGSGQALPGSLDWVLALWSRILNRPAQADRSFFEQGGTSLAALNVLSHYQNQKLELSLAQFYDHPTARAQSELFRTGVPRERADSPDQLRAAAFPKAPTPSASEASPDAAVPTGASVTAEPDPVPPVPAPASHHTQTPIPSQGTPSGHRPGPDRSEAVFPRFVPALPSSGNGRKRMGTVLLTGATGFLGVHLLTALLDAGADQVLCTMRDGSRERLLDTLRWYFGSGCAAGLEDRIQVIPGDITRAGLGLSPLDYQALSGRIDAVWHCAADVRHYAAREDDYLAVNVTGTENLIKLARAANVPLYHMSTGSVGGTRLTGSDAPVSFTEDDFDLGQNWRDNLYTRSKFLAEHAVFEAVRSGLTGRVFRVGRLVGRASDGTFQRDPSGNAFWLLLRAIHDVGAIPASLADQPVELTPVDWCARAAVALRAAPMAALHLQNPTPPTLREVAAAIAPRIVLLSDDEFDARLDALPPADGRFAPLLDYRGQLRSGPPTITVTCGKTMAALEQAGFRESIPGPDRLLRAFRFAPAGATGEGR